MLRRWGPSGERADPDGGPGGGDRPGRRLPPVRVHPGDRAGPGRARRQRPRRGVRRGRRASGGGQRIPPPAGTGRAPAGQDRAGHHAGHHPEAVGVLRHRRQRASRQYESGLVRQVAPDPGIGGRRDLRGLPARAYRSGRPAVRVPVHQLHQLRAQVHHRPGRALRPADDDHGGVRDVRAVRRRIPRPRRPSLPRPADLLPGLRAPAGAAGPGRKRPGGRAAGGGRRTAQRRAGSWP